jgi:hypothetical protein
VLEVLSPNENTNFTLPPAFTPSIATLDAEVNLPRFFSQCIANVQVSCHDEFCSWLLLHYRGRPW